MALWGARWDCCPRTCTLDASHPPPALPHSPRSGLSQRHVRLRAQTVTCMPPRALTMKRDLSQWSFVSSEKNKNTGYKRTAGRQWGYWTGRMQLEQDAVGSSASGFKAKFKSAPAKVPAVINTAIISKNAVREFSSSQCQRQTPPCQQQNAWCTMSVQPLPCGLPCRRSSPLCCKRRSSRHLRSEKKGLRLKHPHARAWSQRSSNMLPPQCTCGTFYIYY